VKSSSGMIHRIVNDIITFPRFSMNFAYAFPGKILVQGITPQSDNYLGLDYFHLTVKPFGASSYFGR
jgi:hypothetical protein